MNNSKAIGWISRHKASTLWLALGVFGAFAHFLARWRMERSGRQFDYMDPNTVRHMPLIDVVQAHLFYPIGYVTVFLAALLWLECRGARPWITWTTFVVLALPGFDYLWVCLALGTRFAIYNP